MRYSENSRKFFLVGCLTIAVFCVVTQHNQVFGQTTGSTAQQIALTEPSGLTATEIKTSYQGGVFGLERKSKGVLKFDDAAQTMNFTNKKSTTSLSLGYSWIKAATVTTRKGTPQWVAAFGAADNFVPAAGFVASTLIRAKDHYLLIQYQDQDTGMFGVASFKFNNQKVAQEALNRVIANATLVPRNSIFVRQKNVQAQLHTTQN